MARIPCFCGWLLLLTILAGCGQPVTREILAFYNEDDNKTMQDWLQDSDAPEEANALAKRQDLWQAKLDGRPFEFRQKEASAAYSLDQCKGEPRIQSRATDKEYPSMGITFEVLRDGKVLLKIHGDDDSVFRVADGVLYFAHFPSSDSGCTVVARDMNTGKELWTTSFNPFRFISHFAYSNQVTMDMGDKDDPNAIVITEQESGGNHVTVLDRETGQVLAKKVYRRGWD